MRHPRWATTGAAPVKGQADSDVTCPPATPQKLIAGAALRTGGIAARRDGSVLTAKFPDELGLGAWVFVEQAAALPWRA